MSGYRGWKPVFTGLVLFLTLFLWQSASAKGRFAMLSVCDARGECFEVRDARLLDFRAFTAFQSPLPTAPDARAESFLITRYGWDLRQEAYVAIDRLTYYMSAVPGSNVVFYDGLVGGSSEYDGHWYLARPEAYAALQESRASGRVNGEKAWAAPLTGLADVAAVAVGILLGWRSRPERPIRLVPQ
jgi:hypothetical protein